MREAKTPSKVRGNRVGCMKFIQCPLCYGCRAYSTHDIECSECALENKKENICNTELHKTKLIGDFVGKRSIEVSESISFRSEE